MKTIRLTMAQALVRYLADQRSVRDGKDVPLFAGVWAIFGHGNVAGIGEALYQRAGHAADLPRAQRAGDGARGDRLRQGGAAAAHDGLHHLDRPRRHQHGDGGGGGACQPPAGAAAARRRLRQPPARSGAAAGRGFRRRHRLRQRLLPAGVALFRPHHAAGADHAGPAPRHAGADRSGGMRPGDAGAVPGRAGRGLRLSRELLRRACLGAAPRPSRIATSWRTRSRALQARQEAADHRRAAACSIPRPTKALADFAEKHGIPVAETQAGKSRAAVHDHKLNMGSIGVTGTQRRQRAGAGGRPGARDRHAAAGFHHRLAGRCSRIRSARSSASTCSSSTPASIARCRWWPMRAPASRRSTRRWATGRRRAPGRSRRQRVRKTWTAEHAAATAAPNRGAAVRRAGDRRGAARGQAERHRGRARPAACRANCTSCGRPARRAAITWNTAIPAWATRSPAGSASRWPTPTREVVVMVGDGSYLMMNSEIATSVMLGAEADHRAARQSRLRLHQPAAARDRRRELQQPAEHAKHETLPEIDFAAHAESLGAKAEKVVEHGGAGSGAGPRRARRTAPPSS